MMKIVTGFALSLLVIFAVGCGQPVDEQLEQQSQSLSNVCVEPVKLLRAHSHLYYGYGTFHKLDYLVQVQNLDYHKEVVVHRNEGDGSWVDVPLSYIGPIGEGCELWGGVDEIMTHTPEVEIAVRYTVNGQTYWDNNGGGGNNYRLGRDDGSLLTAWPLLVYKARACDSYFSGLIDVRNIAYHKQVQVHYTEDDWATYGTTDAFYVEGPNPHGIEQWGFGTANFADPAALRFAISYTVDGQTYWDNNFEVGRDYRLQPYTPSGRYSNTCCSTMTATGAATFTACSL